MPRDMSGFSVPEAGMLAALHAAGLPEPLAEFRFHPSRRWRFDFAYPDVMLAIECEGGTWSEGRHVRGGGFLEDCRKYAEATIAGWRVLRFTSEQIESGEALAFVLRALAS